MNRWHVYSWMKRKWEETGIVPAKKEVTKQFPGADLEELNEGMIEFDLAYERDLKHRTRDTEYSNVGITGS